MTLRALAVVAVVSTMSPATAAQQTAPAPAAQDAPASALPKAALDALEDHWKGATVATVDPQAVACQNGGTAAPVVTADFDSDSLSDYAVAVQLPDGIKLAVLLRRGEEYRVMDLDTLGSGQASGSLGIEKRGTRFLNAATNTDDFFSSDTLSVNRCGAQTVVYLWSGSAFRKVPITRK